MEDCIRKMKEVLATRFDLGLLPSELSDDDLLFEDGLGLDSSSAIELIVAIEEEFEIELDDEDLTAEMFKSVRTVSKLVERRLSVE